jgi:hypothetical protein
MEVYRKEGSTKRNMLTTLIMQAIAVLSFFTEFVAPAGLTLVRDWGKGPTLVDMYVYEPRQLAPKPSIIVMVLNPTSQYHRSRP